MALPSTLNLLSVCSGVEGLGLGIKLALPASRVVCYIEREAFCAATLVARMEEALLDVAPVWDDLVTFDCTLWRGLVDCVIGGFPCQPFSNAGKRGGVLDPRHLWPHIVRLLSSLAPPIAFFENVEGLLTTLTPDGRTAFEVIESDLRALGYEVEAGLFSAEAVGAPHIRKRIFIFAYQKMAYRQSEGATAQPDQWGERQPHHRREVPGWPGSAREDLADSQSQRRRQSGEAIRTRQLEYLWRGSAVAHSNGQRQQGRGIRRYRTTRPEVLQQTNRADASNRIDHRGQTLAVTILLRWRRWCDANRARHPSQTKATRSIRQLANSASDDGPVHTRPGRTGQGTIDPRRAGDALADSRGARYATGGQTETRQGTTHQQRRPSDNGPSLAHSPSQGYDQSEQPAGRTSQTEDGGRLFDRSERRGGQLASANWPRLEGQNPHIGAGRSNFDTSGSSQKVSDPIGDRRTEVQPQQPNTIIEEPFSDGEERGITDLPIFPPGPDRLEEWRLILDAHPSLAPAVTRLSATGWKKLGLTEEAAQSFLFRMADGSTAWLDATRFRDDRLRAVGNSVVPLVAAFAFSVLARRAGLEHVLGDMQ